MDMVFLDWNIDSCEVFTPFAVPTSLYLLKRYKEHQIVNELWTDHLCSLIEDDCQNIIGKRGGISRYENKVVKYNIIPSFMKTISNYFERAIGTKQVDENTMDRNKNFILYGGWEPSFTAEKLLLENDMKYSFGLRKGNRIKYDINKKDIKKVLENREEGMKTGQIVGGAGEWVIVDRHNEKLIADPLPLSDGTYQEDAVLLTFHKSPYNPRKDILGVMGAREMGTYFGDILLKDAKLAKQLHEKIHEYRIRNDHFQVIAKFTMGKYKFGSLPSQNIVQNIEILGKPWIIE